MNTFFCRMNKGACLYKVRLEQRLKRKGGKRNMDIWEKNILGSSKFKFKIPRAKAGSV